MNAIFQRRAKAWVALLIGLGIIGVQAQQAVAGQGFTAITDLIIGLAVLKAAAVYFTSNSTLDLGLDTKAKAVVAAVIALLITVVTAFQPILTSGHFTTSDLSTIVLTVLGALGVYAVPNQPIVGVTEGITEQDVADGQAASAAVDQLPAAA